MSSMIVNDNGKEVMVTFPKIYKVNSIIGESSNILQESIRERNSPSPVSIFEYQELSFIDNSSSFQYQEPSFIDISSSDTTDNSPIIWHQVETQQFSIQQQIESAPIGTSTEVLLKPTGEHCLHLYSKCLLCKKKYQPTEYQYCTNCWEKIRSSRPPRKLKRKKRLDNKSKDQKTSNTATSVKRDLTIKRSSTPSNSDPNICIFCLTNKKDAAFTHGQYAHRCCCYTCGKKVWKERRRCPICNRTINNVLKVYDI